MALRQHPAVTGITLGNEPPVRGGGGSTSTPGPVGCDRDRDRLRVRAAARAVASGLAGRAAPPQFRRRPVVRRRPSLHAAPRRYLGRRHHRPRLGVHAGEVTLRRRAPGLGRFPTVSAGIGPRTRTGNCGCRRSVSHAATCPIRPSTSAMSWMPYWTCPDWKAITWWCSHNLERAWSTHSACSPATGSRDHRR